MKKGRRMCVDQKIIYAAAAVVLLTAIGVVHTYNMATLDSRVSSESVVLYSPPTFYAGSNAKLRTMAFDSAKKEPIAGKKISYYLESASGSELVFSGETDESGSLEVEFSVPDNGSYTLRLDAGETKISKSISVEKKYKTLITTDKPIYKPGDLIQLRVLSLKVPSLEPYSGEAVLEIKNPKGTIVHRGKISINEYGIGNTTFRLATELVKGRHTISVIIGQNRFEKTVEVKDYVLPKFKLSFSSQKTWYTPGEDLEATVSAQYFFGKPVSEADVKIELFAYEAELVKKAEVLGKTDDEGFYDLELSLPQYVVGLPLEEGGGRLLLNISVVDSTGHEEKISRTVTVSQEALKVEIIPETSSLSPLPNRVLVFTTYPDGTPAESDVEVTLDRDESFSLESDENGLSEFVFTPEEGKNGLEISASATDSMGNKGTGSIWLSRDWRSSGDYIKVLSQKTTYEVGDTIQLTVLFRGQELGSNKAYVDVVKDKTTVLTKTVELVDGEANLSIDVSEDLAGKVEIHAYKMLPTANLVRDTLTLLVKIPSELMVRISPNASDYRPGAEAKIDFEVTKSGQGTPAALGVVIVDESVLALEEMSPGFEEVYFYLEEELMQPRYEVHGYSFKENETLLLAAEETKSSEQERATRLILSATTDTQFSVESKTFDDRYREAVLEKASYFETLFKAVLFIVPLIMLGLIGAGVYFLFKDKTVFGLGLVAGGLSLSVLFVIILVTGAFAGMFVGPAATGRGWDEDLAVRGGFGEAVMDGMVMEMAVPMAAAGMDQGAVFKNAAAEHEESGAGGQAPRVREFFPETLLFEPSVITDENGKATLTLTMADSITNWDTRAVASTKNGLIGYGHTGMIVFQPFFVDIDVPLYLTESDEVSMRVAVYNYLDETQTVSLSLEEADWFVLLDDSEKTLDLSPNEVTSVYYRIRAKEFGTHKLTVYAYGSLMSDAIRRDVSVLPNGRLNVDSVSDRLEAKAVINASFPSDAVENASSLYVKIYPGLVSQVVEGLDSLLRMPFGCFEQTTSVTYPNVLVLDYLQRTGQVSPEIQLKAEGFISTGYQRLLSYEVDGGGFEWFGKAPANKILTAFGLLEFSDMKKVFNVDPALISRTRDWLLSKQDADGGWTTDAEGIYETQKQELLKKRGAATAYVAWSLLESGLDPKDARLSKALDFVDKELDSNWDDPYSLALAAIAFTKADRDASNVLGRLAELAQEDEKGAYWKGTSDTFVGARGNSADLETTALAAIALIEAEYDAALTAKVITYLGSNKDAFGNWGTTQATINAIKAFILSAEKMTEDVEGFISVRVDGEEAYSVEIDETNYDVLKQFDLSSYLKDDSVEVEIIKEGKGLFFYSVVSKYYVPWEDVEPPTQEKEMEINVSYNATNLSVNDRVAVTARVEYVGFATGVNMIIVDLGIPAGFSVDYSGLEKMVKSGELSKYESTPRQIILYFEELVKGEPKTINYELVATMPIKAAGEASKVYAYYSPDMSAETQPTALEVSA